MINYYLAQDQEQKRLEALNALDNEANKNADDRRKSFLSDRQNFAAGEFDGKIGNIADRDLMVFAAYRAGYQEGIIEYYLGKYKIELETEF